MIIVARARTEIDFSKATGTLGVFVAPMALLAADGILIWTCKNVNCFAYWKHLVHLHMIK